MPEEEITEEETEVAEEETKEEEAEAEAEKETVPLATFLEQRNATRAAEQMAEESNAKFAKLDERLNVLTAKHTEAAEIDKDEDPIGWLAGDNAKIHEKLDQGGEVLQGMVQQQQLQQIRQTVDGMEQQFKATHSDYYTAVKYVADNLDKQLTAMGVSESVRAAQIEQYKNYIVVAALKNNKNPAEALYKAAKATGYKPANGTPDAEHEKLAIIAQGIEQSKSLSGGRTRQPKGITSDALLDLTDDEFDAATDGDNWEKLMGG